MEICKNKDLNTGYVPPENDLVLFCKNCAQIEFVTMKSISHEFSNPNWKDVADEIKNPESCASWLIAMRAFEAVYDKTGEAPGSDLLKASEELEMLEHEAFEMTKNFQEELIDSRYLKELLRFGKSKLHCISSYLGGVASQEACKLIMS